VAQVVEEALEKFKIESSIVCTMAWLKTRLVVKSQSPKYRLMMKSENKKDSMKGDNRKESMKADNNVKESIRGENRKESIRIAGDDEDPYSSLKEANNSRMLMSTRST